MTGIGWALAALVLALPVYPLMAAYTGSLGLSLGVPPVLLLYTVALLLVCDWIFHVDRWAGVLGVYLILRAFPYPSLSFETVLPCVVGLGVYAVAKNLPKSADIPLRNSILGAGVFIAGYAIGEWAVARMGLPIPAGGPIGNTNYTGAFLAVSSVVAPTVLLPIWLMGLAASHSALAGLAAAVGILIRFRGHWFSWCASCAGLGAVLWTRGLYYESSRAIAWKWGMSQWAQAPLFGYGPGSWAKSGLLVGDPGAQAWFAQAHNEWIQLGFEGGLVAFALALGWCCWNQCSTFLHPWGAALPVILIESLGMFPFQIPAVAVLCLVMMGRATRPEVLA